MRPFTARLGLLTVLAVGLSACPAFLADNFTITVDAGIADAGGTAFDATVFEGGVTGPTDDAATATADAAVDSATSGDAGFDASGFVPLTLTVIAYGPASVTASSLPSGVSCSAPSCSQQVAYFAPGTSVQLSASPSTGTLTRWTGACTTASPSCAVTMNGPQSVTLIANAWNYVFTTSTATTANLGGLTGADQLCQQAATAGALPGIYRAWLSTDATNALSRLVGARGWIRVDGAPVFDAIPGPIYYPIALDESGKPATSNTWTGTDVTGARDGCGTCMGWTSDASFADGGYATDPTCAGSPNFTTDAWSDGTNVTGCEQHESLFCFGVDHSAPLSLTKSPGRYAFVSKTLWTPSSGIAAADALCATEATAGNLTGIFLALLSTSTTPAAARFDLTAANWVRTDGLPIATSPSALAIGTIRTTISVYSDGTYSTYAPEVAWTGGTTPNVTGVAQSTCSDWSDASAWGVRGRTSAASSAFFYNEYNVPCTDPQPVYCFQQ